MLLRILIISIFLVGVLSTQAQGNVSFVASGTDLDIQLQFLRSDIVVSGELKFDNQASGVNNFVGGYVPVNLYIDKVYSGLPQTTHLEVLVSNAVLNFPGTELARGRVGIKMYKDASGALKRAREIGRDDPVDIKDYIPSYRSTVLDLRKLVESNYMYQDSCSSKDDREIVIYPNKKYIFFLSVFEDKIYLANLTTAKRSYEYSKRLDKFIDEYARERLQKDIELFKSPNALNFGCKRIVGILNKNGFYISDDEKANYKILIHDEYPKVDFQTFYCNENADQGINSDSAAVIAKALKQYQEESKAF